MNIEQNDFAWLAYHKKHETKVLELKNSLYLMQAFDKQGQNLPLTYKVNIQLTCKDVYYLNLCLQGQ